MVESLRKSVKRRAKRPAALILRSASSAVVEPIETRVMMSTTTIAAWSFPGTVAAPDNSPAPTTNLSSTPTTTTASSLGMTNTYSYAGTTATNSVTTDDITAVAPENFWRIRGTYVATGTAPNIGTPAGSVDVNGWNLNAPQYSQGVEFDVNTTGYQNIGVSFDWESTAQGVRNLQEQYNLNINNSSGWTNIGSPLTDINGVALTGNKIDLSGISGANNDVNFGIRFVSAYDPNGAADGLMQVTDANGTHYPYASSSGGVYNNSSGNWGFDNVQITSTSNTPPTVTANGNPSSTTIVSGTNATFTAAATGAPTPTVKWYVLSTTPGATWIPTVDGTNYSGSMTGTLTVLNAPLADNGYEYEAVFSNTTTQVNMVTTSAATLTVSNAPLISTQPLSQAVAAGTTVTLTSAANGIPSPSIAWQVATPNGSGGYNTFTPITTGVGGYTISGNNLTFIANEGLTLNQYEAVFSNGVLPNATSSPATLTVVGTPIAQWNFTGGEAPPAAASTADGTGNSPYPTYGPVSDIAQPIGLTSDYTGIYAVPEADILKDTSTVNTNYSEYDWRLRSGNGFGPTGSPGTPEGWSQTAPQYDASSIGTTVKGITIEPQGVQWNVDTTGTSNVTFQFDWNEGGISDMQPQYSPDGGTTWLNVPYVAGDTGINNPAKPGYDLIEATTKDFNGIASTTTTSAATLTAGTVANIAVTSSTGFVANQTITLVSGTTTVTGTITGISTGSLQVLPSASGTIASGSSVVAPIPITVNLQNLPTFPSTNGNPAIPNPASNNPNFEFRLVTAYSPYLPPITDGNGLDPTTHGQYATGVAGPVNAQQNVEFDSGINAGDSVPLSYNDGSGLVTSSFIYSSDPATLISNMTAALSTLVGAGNFAVTPSNFVSVPEINNGYPGANELAPVRDGLGNVNTDMTITFSGNLTATNVALISTTNANVKIATWVTGTTSGFAPYVDGNGAWSIGNMSFNGDTSNSGGLGIETNPPATVTQAENAPVTLYATAYSETTPVTAQWYVNGNPVTAVGTTGSATYGNNVTPSGVSQPSGSNQYISTYTFNTDASDTNQTGNVYTVVFSNAAMVTSAPTTLTVVPPAAPVVIIPPVNTSVQTGNVTTISATATGSPAPTVLWFVSTDGGATYPTQVPTGTAPYSYSTTPSLNFAGYVSTLTITSSAALNGYKYEAVFSNGVLPKGTSSPATLTVLGGESVLTDWDFNSTYPLVTSAKTSPDPTFVNNPLPVAAGIDNSLGVPGTAYGVGMNVPYAYYDSATGTDGGGSIMDGDIVNSAGSANKNFNENTWRPRGTPPSSTTAGTPANGFSNFVSEYSQGAQFSVPTTGYNSVYVTLDWYSTTSGELDAQKQYTIGGNTLAITAASSSNTPAVTTGNPTPVPTVNNIATLSATNSLVFGDEVTISGLPSPYDGTFQVVSATPTSFTIYTPTLGTSWSGTGSAYVPTWINLGNPIQAVSNDFYGATKTGNPVPVLFDTSAIAGAANNPNFGVRIVNAYDPYLTNTQTLNLNSQYVNNSSQFSLTFNGYTTGMITYSSNPATMASRVQSALAVLTSVGGASNVTVTALATNAHILTVTFDGALSAAAQPAISFASGAGTGTTASTDVWAGEYANALLVTGPGPNGTTTQVPAPYNGSKGNWRFANIVVHGVVAPPTLVGSPVINGDNPNGLYTAAGQPANGVQRSMVEDVVYTFNVPVTITNANSAFTVLAANNSGGTVPGTLSAYEVANPTTGLMDGTSWAVSLTGNTTAGDGISPSALGSIANGEYTIQINPSYVFAAADGTTSMAAGTGRTDSFYRLFGDINADEVVNGGDNLKLKAALASYNAAFDGNEDGFVNGGDNLIFKRDQSISYLNDGFTLTI